MKGGTRKTFDKALVRIEQTFDRPRDQVFDAWVERDLLEQWFAPDGCTLHIARLDVREGGGYHWCIRNPSFGACWTIGSYLEVIRPERLVFTATIADADGTPRTPASQGHDPAWPQDTIVCVTFTERAGRTTVTLEQDVSVRLAKRTGAHPSWLQMLDRLKRILFLAACVLAGSSVVQTTPNQTTHSLRSESSNTTRIEAGRAFVNGIAIYYEVHGSHDGTPLVLLHGGGSTIDSNFGRVLPFLARTRRVIALDERGHGRSSDRDQPFTFEGSADDVAGLLRELKVSQADLLGFSNGASVALQIAIRHPQLVRKLVFASSFTKREGAQPQVWEFIRQADIANMPQALKDAFLAVNPDFQKLKTMHDKDAARMAGFRDVPDAAVRGVRVPTLIITGDRDVARLEHAIELSRLLPDARLLVLPSGHGDYLAEASSAPADSDYAEITARLLERFLSEPQPHR